MRTLTGITELQTADTSDTYFGVVSKHRIQTSGCSQVKRRIVFIVNTCGVQSEPSERKHSIHEKLKENTKQAKLLADNTRQISL